MVVCPRRGLPLPGVRTVRHGVVVQEGCVPSRAGTAPDAWKRQQSCNTGLSGSGGWRAAGGVYAHDASGAGGGRGCRELSGWLGEA